ncbi:MAG: FMN-binding negative transcriptional regulator [Lysobacteraceae bacterium]
MTLYQPRHFVESDLGRLDRLADQHPFATLVAATDAEPIIAHAPVLYRRGGDAVHLRGHLAKPNPLCHHDGDVTLILHGPQHYVSPGWYPDKEAAARVPTWNYVVAHLHGRLTWFDDEPRVSELVHDLSRHFEATIGGDWDFDPMEERFRRQLRGIVGFELAVTRIEFKTKLSQNHPTANQTAVRDALIGLGNADASTMADWMRINDNGEAA